VTKRLFDIVGALLLLLVFSPVLLAVGIAIVIDSGLPVFFRQERVGLRGRSFRLWKFRTMVVGAERMGAGLEIEANDSRITGVGEFLRKTSLDELPQLFNVVGGSMSLVGPRPTVRSQVDEYTPFQVRRLEVRPGITGWAQVNGRNTLPWSKRIELDVWYVDHRSMRLDIAILWRTIGVWLRPDDVYGDEGGTRGLDS
jgi:lipopolysaccharide/colanic/teichoic acid biosynthesis glycosyltransferase